MNARRACPTIAEGLTLYASGRADALEAVHLSPELLAHILKFRELVPSLNNPGAPAATIVIGASLRWYAESRGDLFATQYAPGNAGVGEAVLQDAEICIGMNDGFSVNSVEGDEESAAMFWENLDALRGHGKLGA